MSRLLEFCVEYQLHLVAWQLDVFDPASVLPEVGSAVDMPLFCLG